MYMGINLSNHILIHLIKDIPKDTCVLAYNMSFEKSVIHKLAETYPDLAAKYTRAVMKAAKWIEENPDEAARIQLEKNYVTGELTFNAGILDSYNYNPTVSGGYDALAKSVRELQEIGIIRKETDAQALIDNSFVRLEGVEDTY